MDTNKDGLPLCQIKGCGKLAKWNIQDGGWKLYGIDGKGEYELVKEWGGGNTENDHYCDEHAEPELGYLPNK